MPLLRQHRVGNAPSPRRASTCISSFVPTPGIITSGRASTPARRSVARRLEDRADLHRVDLGIDDAQAADAQAEHRVLLVQLQHALQQRISRS